MTPENPIIERLFPHGTPHRPPYVIVDFEPMDGDPLPVSEFGAPDWLGRKIVRHMRGEACHSIDALLAANLEHRPTPHGRRTVLQGEVGERYLLALHANERGEA